MRVHIRILGAFAVLAGVLAAPSGANAAPATPLCFSAQVQARGGDSQAAADAFSMTVANMRIEGKTKKQIDSKLAASYGIRSVGTKPEATGGIEPMSSSSTLSMPAPVIYYEYCTGRYFILATWDFTSIPALRSDANLYCPGGECSVGPWDVMGIALSRDVSDPGGYSATSWGATSVYGPTGRNIGDTSNHGMAMEDQDFFCKANPCGADDYNLYHGQVVMGIDVIGCGPLTVHSKYGHSWEGTYLNGVSIGIDSVGISWSNSSRAFNKAGAAASNTVWPC